MQLNLTLIQLVTICAIANGFVFAFLLLEKKENRQANRFLSLLIVSMCLTFTPYMLDPQVWHTIRWLAWLPFSLSYWIGPAFYFYVRLLTGSSPRLQKKDLWHFSPIVLNYLHSIYHLSVGNSNPWPWFHHVSELLESAAIISILIYMGVSYRKIISYQRFLMANISTIDHIDLQWIKRIIVVLVASFLSILVFLAVSSGLFGKEVFDEWDTSRSLVLLLYAGVLYWLSVNGFKQSQTLQLSPIDPMEQPDEASSSVAKSIQALLEEEHLYRNSALSLADLSKHSGLSERSISEAINGELGKNYFQFINEYRVREIKEKLTDPKNDHLKIFSLAMDSGFNSKASFNRIFKSYTGLTPKNFKVRAKEG